MKVCSYVFINVLNINLFKGEMSINTMGEETAKSISEKRLEKLLDKTRYNFLGYEKGYRVLSLSEEEDLHVLSDEVLSDFANLVADKYECKLVSLSQNNSTFSPQTYTFLFLKEYMGTEGI